MVSSKIFASQTCYLGSKTLSIHVESAQKGFNPCRKCCRVQGSSRRAVRILCIGEWTMIMRNLSHILSMQDQKSMEGDKTFRADKLIPLFVLMPV